MDHAPMPKRQKVEPVFPFGPLLAALRLAAHETQQDVASRLNVSSACISSWERGKSRPRWKLMRAICMGLNNRNASALMRAYTAK